MYVWHIVSQDVHLIKIGGNSMVNVIKAVESLREFQTYWINASEEDKKMFFAVLDKDHDDYEKLVEVLQAQKEDNDEYFPYE